MAAGCLFIIGIVAAAFFYLTDDKSSPEEEILFVEENLPTEEKDEEPQPNFVVIDVKGAVKQPGVYTMNEGDRVIDAIRKAGGMLPEADENLLNLAGVLKDEMVIYVAKKGEEAIEPIVYGGIGAANGEDGKIRINTASVDELQKLHGIGPSKAAAIVAYRDENGPFQAIEELTQVPGIGEKTLENMREQIVVD